MFVNADIDNNPFFDTNAFIEQIWRSMYYLDLVIDATRYPLTKIKNRTKAIRPVGLGLMGLADAAIKMGYVYGSPEFLLFCEKIGKILAAHSLLSTIKMASIKTSYEEYKNITLPLLMSAVDEKILETERNTNGLALYNVDFLDLSKLSHETLVYIYKNIIKNDKIPFTFRNAIVEASEVYNGTEWMVDLLTYGLRNSRRLSIAPTGTIALILNTSSSIEPNFAYSWDRKVTVSADKQETLKYYHKLYSEDNKNKGLLVTASDISIKEHTECVAIFAKYIDSGISKTVNLPNDATIEDVREVYSYCFENNIKGITIYRDGSRDNQPLVKTDITKQDKYIHQQEEVICDLFTKKESNFAVTERPKIMHGITTKSDSPYGSIYVTANFDKDNKMFETFISAGKSGSISKSVTEALSRVISLALRKGVIIEDIVKTISNISGSELWVYDAIDGKEIYVKSIPDAVAKMMNDLNTYYKQLENFEIAPKINTKQIDAEIIHGDICPDCGSVMAMVSGCAICQSCGSSPCR